MRQGKLEQIKVLATAVRYNPACSTSAAQLGCVAKLHLCTLLLILLPPALGLENVWLAGPCAAASRGERTGWRGKGIPHSFPRFFITSFHKGATLGGEILQCLLCPQV